jgi:hypothetical protein
MEKRRLNLAMARSIHDDDYIEAVCWMWNVGGKEVGVSGGTIAHWMGWYGRW